MTFREYIRKCDELGFYNGVNKMPWIDKLHLGVMAQTTESAEALDTFKKVIFHGHPLDLDTLILEEGDVVWYMGLLLKALSESKGEGMDSEMPDNPDDVLTLIMEQNIDKLIRRYPDGFSRERSMNREH